MSMVLAIDLILVALLGSQLVFIIWANKIAFKDPAYCMFRKSAFLYSVAAGFSGATSTLKMYLMISLPILLIALGVTYYFGLSITFYFVTISQAICLTIVVVLRKLNVVQPVG